MEKLSFLEGVDINNNKLTTPVIPVAYRPTATEKSPFGGLNSKSNGSRIQDNVTERVFRFVALIS